MLRVPVRIVSLLVLSLFAFTGITTAVAPEAAAYEWSRELEEGDTGEDVRELQIRIAGWAADGAEQTYVAVDGVFGPGTKAALQRFQKAYGLSVTGVVDTATQEALNALEDPDGSTVHFDFAEFESKDGSGFSGGNVDAAKLVEPGEKSLHDALAKALPAARAAVEKEDFAAAMKALAGLRAPVDAFFDKVLVNAPEEQLRRNRLLILSRFTEALSAVADFSKIEG